MAHALHQKVFEERFLYHADKNGLHRLGRVRRLGMQPDGAVGWRAPATRPGLHHTMVGSAGTRLLASEYCRLVSAQRNLAINHRSHHSAGRRDTRHVPGDKSDGHHAPGAGYIRLFASLSQEPMSTIATITRRTRTPSPRTRRDWPKASRTSIAGPDDMGAIQSGRFSTTGSRTLSANSAVSGGTRT